MKRVMVLVGGLSNEREISLKTGLSIARALEGLGEEVRLLDTGRPERPALPLDEFEALLPAAGSEAGETDGDSPPAGTGEVAAPSGDSPPAGTGMELDAADGTPAAAPEPDRALLARRFEDAWRPELVFIALHGGMGEDGTVQALLDWLDLSYTGCGMEASALAMDKMTSKRIFRDAGLAVPESFPLRVPPERVQDPLYVDELAKEIEAALGFPAVIKPNREGSSVGLAILRSREEASLKLPRVIRVSDDLLVESYIPGREITVAILGGRVLPPVEILPESGLYDYEHKYSKGKTRYQCPAELSPESAERIGEEALLAWELLGCRHLARVDFRLDPEGTPFILEINTIPGMTETSLFPLAAAAAGLDFPGLVAEIARLALE